KRPERPEWQFRRQRWFARRGERQVLAAGRLEDLIDLRRRTHVRSKLGQRRDRFLAGQARHEQSSGSRRQGRERGRRERVRAGRKDGRRGRLMPVIAKSSERVAHHTSESANERIRREMRLSVAHYGE